MKLTMSNTTVTSSITSGGVKRENEASRIARMSKFFQGKPLLYIVGNLLATASGEGSKTWGDILAEGRSIELDELYINGTKLPLVAGFTLALSTLATWACPACGSAHGTGLGASASGGTGASVKNLHLNRFYYDPSTKELFTISSTCFGSYVKALGFATDARFRQVPTTSTQEALVTPPAVPAVKTATVPAVVKATK